MPARPLPRRWLRRLSLLAVVAGAAAAWRERMLAANHAGRSRSG